MLQLFKGTFYYCDGPNVETIAIRNKSDCINTGPPFRWINRKYNFDNLGQVWIGQWRSQGEARGGTGPRPEIGFTRKFLASPLS